MLGLDPAHRPRRVLRTTAAGPRRRRRRATRSTCRRRRPAATCPFRPDRGVANYYGVGAYRRPLRTPGRAAVRFASECLAFANVPDDAVIESLLPGAPTGVVVHHPAWKAGVPRDVGTGWDFDDVRDHYLALLLRRRPGELRRVDHERYLELSRAVTGEVMAEVFGEWRRAGSPCGGGARPVAARPRRRAPAGACSIIGARPRSPTTTCAERSRRSPSGRPTRDSAAWSPTSPTTAGAARCPAARRALSRPRAARRRRRGAPPARPRTVPTSAASRTLSATSRRLLGLSLRAARPGRHRGHARTGHRARRWPRPLPEPGALSQAFRFPAGRPTRLEPADRLGLSADARPCGDGVVRLTVRSRRLAYGVRIHAAGYRPGRRRLLGRARRRRARSTFARSDRTPGSAESSARSTWPGGCRSRSVAAT